MEAAAACKAKQLEFVTVLNKADQEYYTNNIGFLSTYIGVQLVNGQWTWQHNGTPVPASFANWENNVTPTDPEKACAIMDGSKQGMWTATNCAERNLYICESQK